MQAVPRIGALSAKESYIAISNYLRGQRRLLSTCICACRPYRPRNPRLRARTLCHSASVRTNDAPIREPLQFDNASSNESEGNDRTRHKRQGGNISDLPEYAREKLRLYETRSDLGFHSKSVHDWYSLRELARGNDLDHGKLSKEIGLYGFITSKRKARGVTFYQLVDPHLRLTLQLIASDQEDQEDSKRQDEDDNARGTAKPTAARQTSKQGVKSLLDSLDLRPHTPVLVSGRLASRPTDASATGTAIAPHFLANVNLGLYKDFGKYDGVVPRQDPFVGDIYSLNQIEMRLSSIVPLNSFPESLIAKAETKFPPQQRHLQLRTDSDLRQNLRTRSLVEARSHKFLYKQGFDHIETPLLFKSTPEGAREFIVPTRKLGMAYALPQSPQQYKQLLMASGISRYFQFARCFRDEDMRADRQPEFTQLDLEMSFAGRENVMSIVEYLVAAVIWPDAKHRTPFQDRWEYQSPFYKWIPPNAKRIFPVLTYQQAMELYGSDKPDLRFHAEFKRVEHIVPTSLKEMLTSLDEAALEMFKVPLSHRGDPRGSSKFIGQFLDSPDSAVYLNNPAGAPGVTVYDPTKPLNGLAAFGHDAASQIDEIFRPQPGDILLIQARPLTDTFTGGSTPLGNLRRDVLNTAVAQDLLIKPMHDAFVWVTDFPLFSPTEESEPGQGGSAGICSTHHPFTAPRAGQDLTKLYTDPLSLIGDHYDLVINGVEVGGGSVRIHDADIQELIFKDVLKMSPERMEDFRHLLDALSAGCPPHAGFALGFDRLMAVLLGKDSVRDVIVFPKTAAGEDKMVSSPSKLTKEQLDMYHLAIKEGDQVPKTEPLSLKA